MNQTSQLVAAILILPFVRYELLQQQIANAWHFDSHVLLESVTYLNVPTEFVRMEAKRSNGFRSVIAELQLLRRDKKIGSDQISHFLESVKAELQVTIPEEFESLFRNAQMTDNGGLSPNVRQPEYLSGEVSTKFDTHDVLLTIKPPESLRNGQIECWYQDKLAWSAELWTATNGGFGRSEADTILVRPVLSDDCQTIFVFSVHSRAFCIVQFDLKSGDRLGSIITLSLYTKEELDDSSERFKKGVRNQK